MRSGLQRRNTAIISAIAVGTLLCSSVMMSGAVLVEAAETTVKETETASQATETTVTTETDPIGSSEAKKKTDTVKKTSVKSGVTLWKADLSEYGESLSLQSYETVKVKEDKKKSETDEEKISRGVIRYDDEDLKYDNTPSYSTSTASSVPKRDTYEIDEDIPEGSFAFTTYGYGHCVGLSQNGANFYAEYGGYDYREILQHYYPGTYIETAKITKNDKITANGETGSVLDIVSRIVNTEIGSSMNVEAIKAQAVAIYTYIMYYGGSVDDLYPSSSAPQNVVDAVNSVLGEMIYYDGSPALAMFSASSGGSTASCCDVFYEDIPYLRSVYNEYDSDLDPHYGSVEVISAEQVRVELEAALNITLSDDPNNWINIIEGDGGYAAYVDVDGQVTIKGNDFRYYLGLKSPKFTYTYH